MEMISTRGRYAIRVMLDLAENDNGSFIPLKDVAARQMISRQRASVSAAPGKCARTNS